MLTTIQWELPMLTAGQAQKEVTHNEALVAIDRLLHPSVVSRRLAEPDPSPKTGDCYIVNEQAIGEWLGKSNVLASFNGFGWTYTSPRQGCLAWVADERSLFVYDSGGWQAIGRIS